MLTSAQLIRDQDATIQKMHLDVKLYLAQLGQKGLDEGTWPPLNGVCIDFKPVSLRHRIPLLGSCSTSLSGWTDKTCNSLSRVARRLEFLGSRTKQRALLALNVMLNQNPAEARELVEAKEKVRNVEQKLQRSHIGRLREGLVDSIETSNIHQETLRALKQINTAFSQIGYPILYKSGDLLESRLT